jgi:outer membrane protein OmpA-like peptidoglycan-associated protein
MIDAAVQEGPDGATENTTDPTPDELSELRGLLLAPEQTQLSNLQDRLDNPIRYAQEMSRALPDALALRAKDSRLTTALMPTVEEAIGISVKKNPQRLVDAISPVMGPAIRKAIANALSEMVQSLNKSLEYSVSLKGLKWRLEALRTGKSFAEVVLAHTLLYRVEQVFLIHRETGLLLAHVEAGGRTVQHLDLVSGMLTAIQDFVHDSFGSVEGEALDSMQVGELTVWIERGSQAVLALVIRGSPPAELRRLMQDELDAIHVDQREALGAFSGDASPFEPCRPHLELCIQQQTEAVTRKRPSPVLLIIASSIIAALGLWAFFSIRENRRWNDFLNRLKSEPGIIVMSAGRSGGTYLVTGLRDPMSADPTRSLAESGIDAKDVAFHWEPYQAAYPEFITTRANALLQPPDSASISFKDGALVVRGYASHDWIVQSRRLAYLLPGVARMDDSELVDSDNAHAGIESLRHDIEQGVIRFAVGSSEITPDQQAELERALALIGRIAMLSQSRAQRMRVEVLGSADPSGSQEINSRLVAARAEAVVSALTALGAKQSGVEVVVSNVPGTILEHDRTVRFKVRTIDAASGTK